VVVSRSEWTPEAGGGSFSPSRGILKIERNVAENHASLTDKKQAALAALRQHGKLVVALSGGVDSAVLLALAVEAVGPERVLAVTGRSASLGDDDLADAREVARHLSVRHEVLETREMDREGYRANRGDRCYHCRSELFDLLVGLALRRGFDAVAYGAILDDLDDARPGMKAASERRVLAPLLDARLRKDEVRALAEEAGLRLKDKPASPCLSSRIPVGTEVTEGRLDQVRRAESALRSLGFRQFRVRHHGDVARLELDPEGERLILDPGVRAQVAASVRASGFRFVTVDLEGYRSGSLNPGIPLLSQRIGPNRSSGQ